MSVKFIAKCTRCRKTWEMTEAQMDEAKDLGVPFSPCCNTVATVETVHLRKPYSSTRGAPEFDAK